MTDQPSREECIAELQSYVRGDDDQKRALLVDIRTIKNAIALLRTPEPLPAPPSHHFPLEWRNLGVASVERVAEARARVGRENVHIAPGGVLWVFERSSVSKPISTPAATAEAVSELKGVLRGLTGHREGFAIADCTTGVMHAIELLEEAK
jgi:hypothetical protein